MSGVLHGQLMAGAAGGAVVDLLDGDAFDTEPSPTVAEASITVNRDGTVTYTGNASSAGYDWVDPKSATVGDIYQINLTVDSGDAPTSGDSTATWLPLTSNRTWVWTTPAGPADLSAGCTLAIRVGTGAQIDSSTISVFPESVT